jgi:hypothetical protein
MDGRCAQLFNLSLNYGVMKLLMFFINAPLWLQVFIVPAAIFGFGAFLLYNKSVDYLPYTILLSIIGTALGVLLAEHIRKKYGLVQFFSRLIATPELYAWNDLDENTGRRK